MIEGLHPELEDSPLLDASGDSKYRAMIGSANWEMSLWIPEEVPQGIDCHGYFFSRPFQVKDSRSFQLDRVLP